MSVLARSANCDYLIPPWHVGDIYLGRFWYSQFSIIPHIWIQTWHSYSKTGCRCSTWSSCWILLASTLPAFSVEWPPPRRCHGATVPRMATLRDVGGSVLVIPVDPSDPFVTVVFKWGWHGVLLGKIPWYVKVGPGSQVCEDFSRCQGSWKSGESGKGGLDSNKKIGVSE